MLELRTVKMIVLLHYAIFLRVLQKKFNRFRMKNEEIRVCTLLKNTKSGIFIAKHGQVM